MKTVVPKNCRKKIKSNNRKKMMAEIGENAFIHQTPKVRLSMRKASNTVNTL